MIKEYIILSILFFLLTYINGLPSNSYYLIDIDKNVSSNESYCSDILIDEHIYRIPKQCQHHLLCDAYQCDEKSFRCVKIRDTLCCLYKYLHSNCQNNNSNRIKDLFRSIYFQISIEHGYCEINLERIEKTDDAYCIANTETTTITTTTTTRKMIRYPPTHSSYKHFHRHPSSVHPNKFRHRLATRQNYSLLPDLSYLQRFTLIEETISSKSSPFFIDSFLSMILSLLLLILI